jgi:hypothetical protein
MRLRLRLTGTSLRLTGSSTRWTRPGQPTPASFLVTETGEMLATEQGDQLLAEPNHGQ